MESPGKISMCHGRVYFGPNYITSNLFESRKFVNIRRENEFISIFKQYEMAG
jgi:hypothetical protein